MNGNEVYIFGLLVLELNRLETYGRIKLYDPTNRNI